ncbi:hypothetical protein A2U01_0080045, partial [Trifolium medium]|nr:hypothetical protein [Trifolium medium]
AIDPQTVLPENSIFASSSDISPADAVPPQTPPNKFSTPFDFK